MISADITPEEDQPPRQMQVYAQIRGCSLSRVESTKSLVCHSFDLRLARLDFEGELPFAPYAVELDVWNSVPAEFNFGLSETHPNDKMTVPIAADGILPLLFQGLPSMAEMIVTYTLPNPNRKLWLFERVTLQFRL